jgi:hypothetical protein
MRGYIEPIHVTRPLQCSGDSRFEMPQTSAFGQKSLGCDAPTVTDHDPHLHSISAFNITLLLQPSPFTHPIILSSPPPTHPIAPRFFVHTELSNATCPLNHHPPVTRPDRAIRTFVKAKSRVASPETAIPTGFVAGRPTTKK